MKVQKDRMFEIYRLFSIVRVHKMFDFKLLS